MSNGIIKQEEGKGVLPSEDFLKGLTEKQRRGLMRLAHLENIPETQAELARALGITERGLYNWWKDPNWCQAIHGLIKKARIKHLPAIENALLREAKKGSFPHQKGFYSLLGDPLEKNQTNVQVNSQVNVAFLNEHRDQLKTIADQFCRGLLDSKKADNEVIEGDFSEQAQGGNPE